MSPTISVVTVCQNALSLLRLTAESVLAQDCPGIEYWVVDGASTDGTREFLSELGARGVHAVSEPDRGIADAMNKGVRLCSGAWVAHLHAGDTYLPGALRAVLARMEAETQPVDILCGYIVKQEEAGDVLYRCEPARLRMDMTIHHPATFVRRDVFKELDGFDPRYPNAMDYDFFLRALVAGKRFAVIPAPLARMAGGGRSDRSLWTTYRETHTIRTRVLRSGWERSYGFFLFLIVRGLARRALQHAGLTRWVAWFRRRFAMAPKG